MVYVFFVENFETVEALTVVDLLRRAKMDVVTVSMEETNKVTSSLGVTIMTDVTFKQCDFKNVEAVVLPGGPGTSNYLKYASLQELVIKEYKKGTLVAAICAAPSILAKWGIEAKSTVYPSMVNEIPNYVDQMVVKDGNVITGKALGASISFSLCIIEELAGKESATQVASGICI